MKRSSFFSLPASACLFSAAFSFSLLPRFTWAQADAPKPVNTVTRAPVAAPVVVAPVATTRHVGHVFIISFDGGKPAVIQQSKMPTLMDLRKNGASTWEAHTIIPSITLVSHTSMLTGVQPEKHKISWNEWIPEKGLVPVPTIFSLAKAQKMTTAMFVGKQKFAHLFLPGSLDTWAMPDYSAKLVAKSFAAYVAEKKPDLCFIHFADSDGAGHKYGWGTPEQIQAFADEDDALKIVINAIKKAKIDNDSVVILTADHGGHGKGHGTPPGNPEDLNIPWIVWGKGVKKNVFLISPILTCDTAATALYLLGVPLPANFDGKPVTEAFNF